MANAIILGLLAIFALINLLNGHTDFSTICILFISILGIACTYILPRIPKLKERKIYLFLSPIILGAGLILSVFALLLFPKTGLIERSDAMNEIYELIISEKYDKAAVKIDDFEREYGQTDLSKYNKAVIKLYQGKYEECQSLLQSVSSTFKESNADWQYCFGETLYFAGKKSKAADYFKKALTINPDHYESLVRMGEYSLYNEPDYHLSLYYLKAAEAIQPRDIGMLVLLGRAYLNVCDYKDAQFYFKLATTLSSNEDVKTQCKYYLDIITEEGGIKE